MSDYGENNQPIIIKKVQGGHAGHHGGSWKVAFADFMTAMMAFFLVLWLVGQEQEIKDAVAGYFKDPVGFDRGGEMGSKTGKGLLQGATAVMDKKETAAMIRKRLEEAGEHIKQNLMLSEEFQQLMDNIMIELTAEGLRIQLVESSDSSFFQSGSAKMNPTGEAILALIAEEVVKLPNRLVFEGHTDATGSQNLFGYSNWDLGADRANFCRKVMMRNGIKTPQIKEVRSYADTRPLDGVDAIDPRNRRVSILVLNDYDYIFDNKLWKEANSPEYGANTDVHTSPSAQSQQVPDSIAPKIDEESFEVPDYLLENDTGSN